MASPHMGGPPRTWCCGEALAPTLAAHYAPDKTAHAMKMCNVDAALVRHMCVAYDAGFIKPELFDMLDEHWDGAPGKPELATLAWHEIDVLFAVAARNVTPAECGPVFTALAQQAREIAQLKGPRVFQ